MVVLPRGRSAVRHMRLVRAAGQGIRRGRRVRSCSVTAESGTTEFGSTDFVTTGASLVVSEIFGPTWQGEGPSLGRRCGFVRLGRCNLACTWCDTPYTWDWERFDPAVELRRTPVDDILSQLDAMDVDMVVISGGEPMLQQRHLALLTQAVHARGWRV